MKIEAPVVRLKTLHRPVWVGVGGNSGVGLSEEPTGLVGSG